MIKIINDIHAGVRSQGGTTPASRAALGRYISKNLKSLLTWATDADTLVVLGDLFDKPKVAEVVLLDVYIMFLRFLRESEADLVLVRGNHDSRSEILEDLCSLELLYNLLITNLSDAGEDPTRVHLIFNEPAELIDGEVKCWIIPHMFNQQLFDAEIARVPACDYLMLHCNFDNAFAVGDHSLNISRTQCRGLQDRVKGEILIAHEHQARIEMGNLVMVLGNQFPSSVADCKSNDGKMAWVIYPEGIDDHKTWLAVNSFRDCAVGDLREAEFIRVSGTCQPKEFAQIVKDISEFRKTSNAFVISNAVKVNIEERAVSKEDVTSINILELLVSALPEQYRERVTECLT